MAMFFWAVCGVFFLRVELVFGGRLCWLSGAGCVWFPWVVVSGFGMGFRVAVFLEKLPRNEIGFLPPYLASPEAVDTVFELSSKRSTCW